MYYSNIVLVYQELASHAENVAEDWFVRSFVTDALNRHISQISQKILDDKISYDEDVQTVLEYVVNIIDVDDYTSEEVHYVVENVQMFCAIQQLINKGLIEEEGNLIRLKGQK